MRVSSNHVESKSFRVVYFLISNSDQDSTTIFLNFFIEDTV